MWQYVAGMKREVIEELCFEILKICERESELQRRRRKGQFDNRKHCRAVIEKAAYFSVIDSCDFPTQLLPSLAYFGNEPFLNIDCDTPKGY